MLRTSPSQATKYITTCAVLHNIGIERGDFIESAQEEVHLNRGNDNNAFAGDGVNMRNYIVDTYFR